MAVKANTGFDSYEGKNNHAYGKKKILSKSFQLKLSFTL
jgi:hypothetical protein